MCCRTPATRRPVFLSHPGRDGHIRCQFVFQSFPEDTAVASFGHVCKNGVFLDNFHGYRIRMMICAWTDSFVRNRCYCQVLQFKLPTRTDTEESIFRIDSPQLALIVEAHPGNVITNAFHSIAGQWWCHHRQIGLTALTGKCSGHVPFLPAWVSYTDDLKMQVIISALRADYFWTKITSMCSASHPSRLAMAEPILSEKHFFPRRELPPYPLP